MSGIEWIIGFIVDFVIMLGINALFLLFTNYLTTNDNQKRVINKKVVIFGGIVPVLAYLILNFMSFSGKLLDGDTRDHLLQNIIFERGAAYLLIASFFIVKAYYLRIQNNNLKCKLNKIFPYNIITENGNVAKYYIDDKYKYVGKYLKVVAIVIATVFSLIQAVFIFNNISYFTIREFIFNYGYLWAFSIVYLIVFEIGVFLDGDLIPEVASRQEIKVKKDLFNEMLIEYKQIFKDNLLLSFDKDDNVKEKEIQKQDDYIYSKIFTPIVEGENIIIETECLYTLNDIVPPLLNLIFATNRKILFITENDTDSIATYEWLKRCHVITENIKQVVQVYTEYKENEENPFPEFLTNLN